MTHQKAPAVNDTIDDTTKQRLAAKNQKIIDMVIERAKRDFPNDIALIGLTGSFATNDFHEKSDLDLIIVNNTDKGWEISHLFILDGVGYDIYCTPWANLEKKAELDDTGVSSLTDLQILYYAKPEYLDKFNALRDAALQKLAAGITAESITRATKHIDLAKQNYADMCLSCDIGTVRYAAATLMYNAINAVVALNNTCIKRGIKRYFEELSTYNHLPENFESLCMAVIGADSVENLRKFSEDLLSAVISLREKLRENVVKLPTPTYENLKGWYEECWCNYRNKMLVSVAAENAIQVFLVALGAQNYFDEMTANLGTKQCNLMQYFDANDLEKILNEFLRIMDEYLHEYEKVGRKPKIYNSFEELYRDFMGLVT